MPSELEIHVAAFTGWQAARICLAQRSGST